MSILCDRLAGMEQLPIDTPRVATVTEVASVAGLLDAFNRGYDTPTPGKAVLATRLRRLLGSGDVIALLTGDPAVAVALLTLRPNVWYDGPVALVGELYVAPELRGRGLGSALLAAAEAMTRQRGGDLLSAGLPNSAGGAAGPQMDTIRATAASYARYSRPTTPTPTPAPVSSAKLYATYRNLILKAGSSGWAVRDAQLELNRRGHPTGTPDGAFGAQTTAGLLSYQRAALLPVTGIIAANDWKALSGLTYRKVPTPLVPPAPTLPQIKGAGFDADGHGDVMGRTAVGDLYLYPGQLRSFSKPVRIGTGWNRFNTVLSPGDFTGDGKNDILARTPAGKLYLYPGNGNGGFATGPKIIGSGWNRFNTLTSPGDFTGDGKNDILARTPAGNLYLYPGNGKGGFATGPKIIGSGWNTFSAVISCGDLTGDRKPDLVGSKPGGRTYLFPSTGKGGYASGHQIPAGWAKTTRLFGVR